MRDIGIGIVGGGYMGKAHAVAMAAVGAVFETALRPRLEMVAGSTPESGKRLAEKFGFKRAAKDWQELVADPAVEAVVIASPQTTHRAVAEAAFALKKPVLCEKPLGASLDDAKAMAAAAETAGAINMVGFNYIRTPASQYARKLIEDGVIGKITWFRGEHTEDFDADASTPGTWRSQGEANGCMGDLAPHMINATRALMGPIKELNAEIETVHAMRGDIKVTNDDQAHVMCRFERGAMGHLFFSRVATGRKMGYAYEINGTKGAIRFDQEDQNSVFLYLAEGHESQRGFRKILTGPEHPDYLPFCQGPGHGTGFQDQIIIEAKDFLIAIATGKNVWPTFQEGLEVSRTVAAIRQSDRTRSWQTVSHF